MPLAGQSSSYMEASVVSKGILIKRRKRREQTFAQLKAENVQLKKIVALTRRKVEHGCAEASCSLCDPEQPGDGTWEFPT